ncbi:MAG: DUF1080 domain-containing protein [Pirellulales bacterium]|nr:DUF1080 domain-containing protein [Pirellulales bacterium]
MRFTDRHFAKWLVLLGIVTSPFLAAADRPAPQSGEKVKQPFVPDQSSLPVRPPDDAIVLFDGQETNLFLGKNGGKSDWPVQAGALVSRANRNGNHVVSKWHFRDADIHVEFMTPKQGSGNSGIYIHGNYELQIVNSKHGKAIGDESIGAIYGFHKPLVNAAADAGTWQVYDIRYIAPRRNEAREIIENGSITAWLNGKKVQDNARFAEPRSVFHPFRYQTTPYLATIWKQQKKTSTGPVFLQDHGAPVQFRNIWIRPLDDRAFVYEAEVQAPD